LALRSARPKAHGHRGPGVWHPPDRHIRGRPHLAATVKGEVGDIGRFKNRDHFAAYNGTAPVKASSGKRKVYRLSREGNRPLNHAIPMAAVLQGVADARRQTKARR
jgi:transposase